MWLWIVIVGAGVAWLISQANSSAPIDSIGTVDFGTGNGPQDWGSNVSATIKDWADLITRFEGGNPGDRNVRNNNPGNLRVQNAPGQTGVDPGGYAVFATWQDGMNALIGDLTAKVRKYPTWSLAQIMARYAPAADKNNPDQYAGFIAKGLKVSVTDTLASIFKG